MNRETGYARWRMRAQASATAAVCLTIAVAGHADPKQECATAYDQTQTSREKGKLIDARKQALVCTASTCASFIMKDCARWLSEIETNLPTVVFAALDAAGADTQTVRLIVDGEPLLERLDGRAAPIDPGPHRVRFELAGVQPVEQSIVIKQGEKNRRVEATLKSPNVGAAPPRPAEPSPSPAEPSPALPPGVPGADAPVLSPAATGKVPAWAWISGGTGLALLAGGVGFGVSAWEIQGSINALCPNSGPCSQNKQMTVTQDETTRDLRRNVFIGLAAAGTAGIVIGIVGIATASSSKTSAPVHAVLAPFGLPGGGGMAMKGAF